jgi:inner membrane protein
VDVVTHALLGATLARATASKRARLGRRERLLLGGVAAAFPDIDFAAFPLDPLLFLAEWHQGPTHSLLLMPLWALLIGGSFVLVAHRSGMLAEAVRVGALGLTSHIAADLITAYGTAILYPLSDARFSIGTTFVIDPLFTFIVALGLGLSLWTGRRLAAGAGLAVLCVYVGGQAVLQQRAVDVGHGSARDHGPAIERLSVVPQPFSPFNWKLIGVQGSTRFVAHVTLADHLSWMSSLPGLDRFRATADAYRRPGELSWESRHLFGGDSKDKALVESLWSHPELAPFRRFAAHPSLSRIDRHGEETCVWFTDLRYDLPALPDTFRFGFCRDGSGQPWQLHRLRYFSDRSRQAL